MKKTKWILALVGLLMIGGAGSLLVRLKANQQIGRPGVKTAPLAGSKNLEVLLPESVPGYTSQIMTQQQIVVATLPRDTSYGQRMYRAADGFWTQVNVVLMGSDRTSLHKPQFCLEGAGWNIDNNGSRQGIVHMERPEPYDLPVTKLLVTRQIENHGQMQTLRGVYVYWFVAEDAYTAQHWQRMWWMARELLQTGVLQRWAYVTYFAVCLPGEEEATFDRMKKLMAASVPDFQLVPKSKEPAVASQP